MAAARESVGQLEELGRSHVAGAVRRGEIQIPAFATPLSAENHAHQNVAAPLEFLRGYLRFLNDEKSEPRKLLNLLGS